MSRQVTFQYSSVSVFLLDDRSVDPGHDGAVPDPEHRLPHSTRGFPEDPVHPSVSGRRRPVTATAHTAAGGAGGPGTDTLVRRLHTRCFALYYFQLFLSFFFLLYLVCSVFFHSFDFFGFFFFVGGGGCGGNSNWNN